MNLFALILSLFVLAWSPQAAAADRLDATLDRLSSAAAVSWEFLSIVESVIFETTDTTQGAVYIAADGRYRLTLGPDQYSFDGKLLYSYSEIENQVTVEQVSDPDAVRRQVSFLLELRRWYSAAPLDDELAYRLVRRDEDSGDLPDSLNLFLHDSMPGIRLVEFTDQNDDLNQILFVRESLDTVCVSSNIAPDYPDSAEIIRIP